MNREIHVRFWESAGVRVPCATQRCCVVSKAKVTIWEGSPAPAGEGAQQPLIERRSDDPHVQVFAQRL